MYRMEDIPVGRKNAISRKNLAAFWGVSDRTARQIISELRTIDDGTDFVIVSVSRFSGYYRTNNPDEIDHFRNEMVKRIRSTRKAIEVAERISKRVRMARQHGGGGLYDAKEDDRQ